MSPKNLRSGILRAVTAAVVLLALCGPPAANAQPPKQKGISYTSWWHGEYSKPDADLSLSHLRETGAEWISLVVTQYQETLASTTISATDNTATDADLIHAIETAHGLGLQVMLKPHVDLSNDPTHWRGEIGQGFTAAQWDAWFSSYRAFLNHYALLAGTHGVEQFCVGTELSGTEAHTSEWRAAIAGVREVYDGPITYASNWGDETGLAWWDAVDFIGVDAYYPLAEGADPTLEELKAAWEPYVALLGDLAESWDKTILFTEIGYRSIDGTASHPWDWQTGGAIDLQEQADAYQAVFESVFDQPWFAGIFWWDWGTDPFVGGACDDGYTPHDKPAEDVLRAGYGAPPRVPPVAPPPDYKTVLPVYTDGLETGWEDGSWGGTIDLDAVSPVYRGTRSISATLDSWGALALYHDAFDSSPYGWLEFAIREADAGQRLRVAASDEHGEELRALPLCVEPGEWTRIRVRLSDLNAEARLIGGGAFINYGDEPAAFWVDEIRWVSAGWSLYLPVVLRMDE
ncbi:MAG: hypothetical protein RBT47_04130 [Anaerolineae bacterium]|jgi:hypothetical protein|nr:hypothetical protein [Anaerolineae bacterium]